MDFIIRIYQPSQSTSLAYFDELTISNITILRKYHKYDLPKLIDYNLKKFNFDVKIIGKFLKQGGSHNYPTITFKNNYIELLIKNFPRYPVFTQDYYVAKNIINGYSGNSISNGYPIYLDYRKVTITILKFKQ